MAMISAGFERMRNRLRRSDEIRFGPRVFAVRVASRIPATAHRFFASDDGFSSWL
jgi:hypothetical protein